MTVWDLFDSHSIDAHLHRRVGQIGPLFSAAQKANDNHRKIR